MENEENDVDKIWKKANELMSEGQYLQAAVEYDKGIKNGFVNKYSNGDWIFFNAAIARALCGDFENAESKFKQFILQNLIVYIYKGYNYQTSISGQFAEDYQDHRSNINGIGLRLRFLDYNEHNKDKGYLKQLLFQDIPKWWQKAHNQIPQNIIKNQTKSLKNSTIHSLPFSTKLDDLVGLDTVKKEVEVLCDVVKIRQLRKDRGLDVTPQTLHMVFTGNPGTGKTTVARILADVFKDIGLLTTGQLIETDRSIIVEKFIGHTAKKMSDIVESAKGGILFIDEAYALIKEDNDKDFGKEAIDTLVKLMEDNRDNLIVIAAGYTNEMQKFLNSNTGLKSRFTYNIHFDDYSIEELIEIFKRLCNSKGYQVTDIVIMKVKTLIEITIAKDEMSFGNARGVRKVFEKIERNQMTRLAKLKDISNEDLQIFLEEDIT